MNPTKPSHKRISRTNGINNLIISLDSWILNVDTSRLYQLPLLIPHTPFCAQGNDKFCVLSKDMLFLCNCLVTNCINVPVIPKANHTRELRLIWHKTEHTLQKLFILEYCRIPEICIDPCVVVISKDGQFSIEIIMDFVLDNQVIARLYDWLPNFWDFEWTRVVVVGFTVDYFYSLTKNTYDDILLNAVKKNRRVSGGLD
jgi:hypothetical protein